MKLIEGRRYVQRNGVVTGPIEKRPRSVRPFLDPDSGILYMADGGHCADKCDYDLVAEYTESSPVSTLSTGNVFLSEPEQGENIAAVESTSQFNAATLAGYSRPQVVTGVLARFPRAMKELAQISALGCAKHGVPAGDMGFLNVPNAYPFYTDKVGRHLVDEVIDGPVQTDPQMPGCTHAGAAAWNALARLEVLLRQRELTET